jgi:hypothetical protein
MTKRATTDASGSTDPNQAIHLAQAELAKAGTAISKAGTAVSKAAQHTWRAGLLKAKAIIDAQLEKPARATPVPQRTTRRS